MNDRIPDPHAALSIADVERLIDDRPADGWFSVHRDAFRDPAVFELEMKHIFEATWNFVGLESQVPNPNDYLSTVIGRSPVVVMRDAHGQLGCFLNSCRHKGAVIFPASAGNGAHHTCPYHGWTYDTGGRCIAITSQRQALYPPKFGETEHDLRRVARFDAYRGLLFASLSDDVPPLAEYLGDARRAIDLIVDQGADGIELVPGAVSFTYNANWKFQLENSSDTYHFIPTHTSYIGVLDKRRKAREASEDARVAAAPAGSIYEDIGAQAASRRGCFTFPHGHVLMWGDNPGVKARPLYASLPEVEARVGRVMARWMMYVRNLTLFPNVQIAENASMQLRIMRPIAVDRTEMLTYCVAPKGEPPEARIKRLRQYEDFFNPTGFATPDDTSAYEACQRGDDARTLDWQQGYVRGMGAVKAGGNPEADELGIKPETSSVGGYLMGDETVFHGNYRAWLALLKRGVAKDSGAA
jgi:phenylpropionate dioxygenase-like ring-hydroxylating dioxygenase large terminal subunit